jgi:hypothetical protein
MISDKTDHFYRDNKIYEPVGGNLREHRHQQGDGEPECENDSVTGYDAEGAAHCAADAIANRIFPSRFAREECQFVVTVGRDRGSIITFENDDSHKNKHTNTC